MIYIKNREDCCGCGACEQICPKNCIIWMTDKEGFSYPSIDKAACVDCGLCEQVCPVIQGKTKPGTPPLDVFAAYIQDNTLRENSSSGGIFSVLAESVMNQGGVVFGAAFSEDFSVHHIQVETVETLGMLRGSKYVQSRTEDTYREAKIALVQGKPVLYSGVGCQIAGLKSFLRKEYDNLFTVDVLCHGTPSPEVWDRYVQQCEKNMGSKLVRVTFRNKDKGWRGYQIQQWFQNGVVYKSAHREDAYFKLFLRDICLRPSCYRCQFRKGRSGSDITLGDAWGIENWMPQMDDDKGTSVVLLNTLKGKKLWDNLGLQVVYQHTELETVAACNPMYEKSAKPHPNRKRFFSALNRGVPVEELVQLTRPPLRCKIASFAKHSIKKVLKIIGFDISFVKKYK